MKNLRTYYSNTISHFLHQSIQEILGNMELNDISAETNIQQRNAWKEEIGILKEQLCSNMDGRIIFEYTIPRKGERVDVVILYKNIVFLLEFKCGEKEYKTSGYNQVYDYALDLRNFQKESHDKLIVPILVATCAMDKPFSICTNNKIISPLLCNKSNITKAINTIVGCYSTEQPFDYNVWENAEYLPTPTIIEAAQALYNGHNVRDITRNDAGAENLTITTDTINHIIEQSRANNRKAICFVTGVPGAGKTLVGLNIAIQRSNARQGEHAVFLSGNFPLVTVLQEALARDKVSQEKKLHNRIPKSQALRSTSAFIQIIHKYRDSFVNNKNIPPERIVIFDEAQRAWTHERIENFMLTKKGVDNFPYSEPEFLIETMNRHAGWAVIICLVGGGQEINTGEAGLPEWFDSLHRSFPDWDVYITPQLSDDGYSLGRDWKDITKGLHTYTNEKLHLATSIRSFRTPDLAAFIKSILEVDTDKARLLYSRIKDRYPLVITRDLYRAKTWVREHCPGTTRYGLLASSGALRLKPEGIFVKNDISVANWFLNDKTDVRSSYALEDVATEFDIQGLELDFSIVAWDADYRFDGDKWTYHNFVGNRWNAIASHDRQLYLKNAYRVLLTRARQGMVIFIPSGNDEDHSRQRSFYDKTFNYLESIGIQTL